MSASLPRNGVRDEVTAGELRAKLYNSLRGAGVVDTIKTHLRAQMLSNLQATEPQLLVVPKSPPASTTHRLTTSLVADFLQRGNFAYSLSIFLAESGVTAAMQQSRDEMLEGLRLSPSSRLYRCLDAKQQNEATAPLALHLLAAVAETQAWEEARTAVGTQTEECGSYALSVYLQQVDQQYERLLGVEEAAPYRALEARMHRFRRECEERAKAETAAQVQRVREFEVGQARMEEAARYRRNLQQAREELERVHEERLSKLRAREESLMERSRRQVQALEAAAYEHRQRLLKDGETLRKRKEELSVEMEQYQQSRRETDEALRRREEAVATRVDELGAMRRQAHEEAERAVAARRREVEAEEDRVMRDGVLQRDRLEIDRRALQEERARFASDVAAISEERARACTLAVEVEAEKRRARAQADVAEELARQIEMLNAQLAQARDELDSKYYGAPLALTKHAGKEEALLTGHTTLASVLDRARAETETGKREILRLQELVKVMKKEAKTWQRERDSVMHELNIWRQAAATAERETEDAIEEKQEALGQLEEACLTLASVRRELEQESALRVRTQHLLENMQLSTCGAGSSPLGSHQASPHTDSAHLDSAPPKSGAGVGGSILEETMRRLQRLQQEEDQLDVSLLDYKARRARASHLDPHALFGKDQPADDRIEESPESSFVSSSTTSMDSSDCSDYGARARSPRSHPRRARHGSGGKHGLRPSRVARTPSASSSVDAGDKTAPPERYVRVLIDGKEVFVRASMVQNSWADSPDLPRPDPLAEPHHHMARESPSAPVPGPFDSPIVFKPPATESGTPEMGTPTKLVFMSLQDDDNLAAASAELQRQQREEAVNGRVSPLGQRLEHAQAAGRRGVHHHEPQAAPLREEEGDVEAQRRLAMEDERRAEENASRKRREAVEAEERELVRLRAQREAEEKLWRDQQLHQKQRQQQRQAVADAELAAQKAEEECDSAARMDQLQRDQQEREAEERRVREEQDRLAADTAAAHAKLEQEEQARRQAEEEARRHAEEKRAEEQKKQDEEDMARWQQQAEEAKAKSARMEEEARQREHEAKQLEKEREEQRLQIARAQEEAQREREAEEQREREEAAEDARRRAEEEAREREEEDKRKAAAAAAAAAAAGISVVDADDSADQIEEYVEPGSPALSIPDLDTHAVADRSVDQEDGDLDYDVGPLDDDLMSMGSFSAGENSGNIDGLAGSGSRSSGEGSVF